MPVNAPTEVVDPVATVAAAEYEASALDILVCGNCQGVFHFAEEFQEHKAKNDCEKADKTNLNVQGNKKPQVWAFLIWKNSQQKADDQQGSWKLYQKWCNMPETQRQSWVTAGRNIQAFINLSHARELNKFSVTNTDIEEDIDDYEEEFVVEKIVGKRYNHKTKQVEYLLKWEGYPSDQNTWEPLSNLTTCRSLLQEYERSTSQQSNDKSAAIKLPGVLKKDNNISPQLKLQNANLSKPSGIIPNKCTSAEKKSEPVTPALQTQRKIVPVSPVMNNNITSNKVAVSTTPVARPEAPKLADTVNSAKVTNITTEVNAVSKPSPSSAPFKKRIISSVKESSLMLSPDKSLTKIISPVKELCKVMDNEKIATVAEKRSSDGPDEDTVPPKRLKPDEVSEEPSKVENEEQVQVPKSGIFKKSDLKDKYPSINSMFGNSAGDSKSKSTISKNGENQRGILKIDHSQNPDLMPGIYKMSVNGSSIKIDLLANDKSLTAILPVMPGPKGGVVILGNMYDSSKIVKISTNVQSSPERIASPKLENPAFRGIFLKNKLPDDNATKVLKPDFSSANKVLNTPDSSKKPVNSSLRKVIGTSLPKGKGKISINSPIGISRFRSNFVKSYNETQDASSSRSGEADSSALEFCDADNTDSEEYALPDDFPEELDMEPLSPMRPLTLDPETGKRLMRAEGEPTPEPTPEPSPVPSPVPPQIVCKEENDTSIETENIALKKDDDTEETLNEIDGHTYKVTSANEVGLLENNAFTKTENEINNLAVADGIADEENENNMLTITGEDGLVYQVANAKLEDGTIVVSSGADNQQCVFVTEDGHQVIQRTNEDGSTVLTLESAYADAVAQLVPNQVNILPDGSQIYVKQEENGQVELVQIQGSEMAEQEAGEQEVQIAENTDENPGQVVAQLIEAGEPAPGGGPRRVVLLLPDGNLMVTEVDEEQFAALELEK